uniref:Annexin n=1 Tax=Schistosoma japonicum TaxID=6182 RepID=C1L7Y5_SCHJA|nr:Annexin A13 (Annexin XIII) [Schistosoma japonicum]
MGRSKIQIIGPNGEIYQPTLKIQRNNDPNKDAEVLYEAMKGWGTNEHRIIEILGYRTSHQRIIIRDQFKALYGKDLITELSSETSGHFKKLLKMLLTDTDKMNARALYKAMKGGGTDESTIIEVLCTSSNCEIEDIKTAYQSVLEDYGISDPRRTLESDVEDDLSGPFKNLVIALLQAKREEIPFEIAEQIQSKGIKSVVDMNLVEQDVETLWDAGEAHLGTDEAAIIKILVSRSVWHIQAIAQHFEKKYGKSLIDSLASETSGDFESALLLTLNTCLNRPKAYSDLLVKAMKGLGTDDCTLMRIIVSRCELDLGSICQEFERSQGSSLEEWIRSETSGDYQKLLLALIGAEWS